MGLALLVGAVLAVFALSRRSAEARGDGGDSLYRCHLEEDTACTIVRQTGRGVVVVSYRLQVSAPDAGPAWSVLITDAAGVTQPVRPGTVTIIPVDSAPAAAAASGRERTAPPAWPAPAPTPVGPVLPNSAPIIE